MSEIVARKVVVGGRVQGVFFRDSTRQAARRHGVAGWVRNCPEGTVEAWFEGEADVVESMVPWCSEGPRHADVEDVDVSEVSPESLSGFAIR